MYDISTFGLKARVISPTMFPLGFKIDQWGHVGMPVEIIPSAPTRMDPLVDGTLFGINQTAPIIVRVTVIAGGEDDENLRIMLSSSRSYDAVLPIEDTIAMALSYPSGGTILYSNGGMTNGPMGNSATADGYFVPNTYEFTFGTASDFSSVKSGISTTLRNIGSIL